MKSNFLIDFYIYLIGGTIRVFLILLGLPPLSTPAEGNRSKLELLGYPTVCRSGVIMGSVLEEIDFPFFGNGSFEHSKF
jgi:hypothetical protein